MEEKKVSGAQSYPNLCDPMDYSLLSYYVHEILQAKTQEGKREVMFIECLLCARHFHRSYFIDYAHNNSEK